MAVLLLLSIGVVATVGYVVADRERDVAYQNLYLAHMHLAHRAWDAAEIVQMQKLLDENRPTGRQNDRRGWEWYYLQSLGHKCILSTGFPGQEASCDAWSPDGQLLASGYSDTTVKVWDASTGEQRLPLSGHEGSVNSVDWNADSRRLASASTDKTVKIWDLSTGQPPLTFSGHPDVVTVVAWSHDGKRLASASIDGTVCVCEGSTGKELLRFHVLGVRSLCWAPDDKQLGSTGASDLGRKAELRICDSTTGSVTLAASKDEGLQSITWSPDGRRLATGGWNSNAIIWDAVTAKELLVLEHPEGALAVAWSPDGSRLASASRDRTIKVWNATTGKKELTLRGHTSWTSAVSWRPNGQQLASVSPDKTIKVWDVTTEQEAASVPGFSVVSWSRDGRLATRGPDQTLTIYDSVTGKRILSLPGHRSGANAVAWDREGQRLASAASFDKVVKVWDTIAGRELCTLVGHTDWVNSVSWSPDGQWLASASRDGTVKVWDTSKWVESFTLAGATGDLEYEYDGGMVRVSGRDDWKDVLSIAWSADSKFLAGGEAATGRSGFGTERRGRRPSHCEVKRR